MCLRASGVTSSGGPHRRAEIDYSGSRPLGVIDRITLCAYRQAPIRGKGSQLSHSPVICKGDHYRQGIPMSQADSYSPQQFFFTKPLAQCCHHAHRRTIPAFRGPLYSSSQGKGPGTRWHSGVMTTVISGWRKSSFGFFILGYPNIRHTVYRGCTDLQGIMEALGEIYTDRIF